MSLTWNLSAIRAASRVLAVLTLTLLWASTAHAGTKITQTACTVVIHQPGEYTLAANIGPCAPGVDGIQIQASGVTLHLAGHTITGSAGAGTCNTSNGIRVGVAPGITGVSIQGPGTIANFHEGVRAQNSSDSSVKRVTVTANCPFFSYGLVVLGPGDGWQLEGNVVEEPGLTSTGILVQNKVDDTIAFFDSNDNIVVNNTANDNDGGIGFLTISTGCHRNEIHGNTTDNNSSVGGLILGNGSTHNNITGNKSLNNLPFDIEDDNPNCGHNKYEGNHFHSANQTCIR
jgi:hypothetical protein